MTEQRRIIYDIVMASDQHPTADQIYAQAKLKKPDIAIGTVYRNLGLMVESGEIIRIAMPNGPDRYDRTVAPHEHMTCDRCGGVVDINLDHLADIIEERAGVHISSYKLALTGICPSCSSQI